MRVPAFLIGTRRDLHVIGGTIARGNFRGDTLGRDALGFLLFLSFPEEPGALGCGHAFRGAPLGFFAFELKLRRCQAFRHGFLGCRFFGRSPLRRCLCGLYIRRFSFRLRALLGFDALEFRVRRGQSLRRRFVRRGFCGLYLRRFSFRFCALARRGFRLLPRRLFIDGPGDGRVLYFGV